MKHDLHRSPFAIPCGGANVTAKLNLPTSDAENARWVVVAPSTFAGELHLIDSDGTLHDNHTSTHPPLGEGNLDFDAIMPDIAAADSPDDWWTIDLCFWPDAWAATAKCKTAIDGLAKKYG